MNKEQIIKLAREAGISESHAFGMFDFLERFAALVAAAEREKVAQWMLDHSYATGHGDTTEDLLKELDWQIRDSEREACAKVCEEHWEIDGTHTAKEFASVIRARGEK